MLQKCAFCAFNIRDEERACLNCGREEGGGISATAYVVRLFVWWVAIGIAAFFVSLYLLEQPWLLALATGLLSGLILGTVIEFVIFASATRGDRAPLRFETLRGRKQAAERRIGAYTAALALPGRGPRDPAERRRGLEAALRECRIQLERIDLVRLQNYVLPVAYDSANRERCATLLGNAAEELARMREESRTGGDNPDPALQKQFEETEETLAGLRAAVLGDGGADQAEALRLMSSLYDSHRALLDATELPAADIAGPAAPGAEVAAAQQI